jgi:hypothetical protein
MIRWDPSSIECLPDYMKGVYMAVYDTINEMAQEAERVQGRDTVNYVRQIVWTIIKHTFTNISLWETYLAEIFHSLMISEFVFLCLWLFSGRLILIRIWKKQSGFPVVICQRSRSTWITGKSVSVLAQPQCNPSSRWVIPFLFTSCRKLIFHRSSMTWYVPSSDWRVTLAATK